VSGVAGRWPLVSVILPTRGRPRLVREVLAAIIGQSYPGRIECIVVHDEEPPDPSLAHLGTAQRSVVAVPNTHTPGLAGSRNTGLGLARGEFIATCDDDDIWHAGKLAAQIARLLREPDLLAVGCGMRMLLPGGRVITWPGRAERISYQLLLRNRVKELHSSTLVMRREAFARAGPYDEGLPRSHAEDYDWVLRAARAGGVGTVREPLADIHKDLQTSRERWDRGGAENVAAALEYLLAKHPDIAACRRGHARLLGQIAFARSTLGQRRVALRYALRAVARWPASPHAYVALAQIVTGIDRRQFLRAARVLRRGLA
jgi:glycosyltransferase involved in cell wall biosynthesis